MMWQQLARLMRKRAVPRSVTLREVGLRDGLHSFKTPLPTLVKFDWVLLGYAAGLHEIEVGSFVRPDVLPQMADTAEVVAFAKTVPDLVVSVLVHDRAGARDALAAGVDLLTLPISASAAHCVANVGKTPEQMLAELRAICAERDALGSRCRVEAGIGTAFGCALEGDVAPDKVLRLVQASLDAGVECIGLSDTIGAARPEAVRSLFAQARRIAGNTQLSAHLHDTGDQALPNVTAALEAGVERFDASLAGIGGSSFLPDIGGNVSIEAVTSLLAGRGVDTGIELARLRELNTFVRKQPDAQGLFDALSQVSSRAASVPFASPR